MKLIDVFNNQCSRLGLDGSERYELLLGWMSETEDQPAGSPESLAEYIGQVASFLPAPPAIPVAVDTSLLPPWESVAAQEDAAFFDLVACRAALNSCQAIGYFTEQSPGAYQLHVPEACCQRLQSCLRGELPATDQPQVAIKVVFLDGDTFGLQAYGGSQPYLDAWIVYGDHRFPYHACPSHLPVRQPQPLVFNYPDNTSRTVLLPCAG